MDKDESNVAMPSLDEIVQATMAQKDVKEQQYKDYMVKYADWMKFDCQWNPCTYILFGQAGETHEAYHVRKGKF